MKKGTKHRVPIVFLFLALIVICSLNVAAQDKLLITPTNKPLADPGSVDCWQYDTSTPPNCIGGQYFHSDNSTPTTNWTPIATSNAYGAWTTSPNNGSTNGCISCHHGTVNALESDGNPRGGAYLIGGHKNILRKVVPGQPLLNSEGLQVSTVVDHNGAPYTIDWTTGLLNPGSLTAYVLAGWIPEPDVFGAGSVLAYGSCGRCHTTGYRFDDNGPEPTRVTLGTPNTYTKLTTTEFSRTPAGSASPATSSWYLTGINCERCHKVDMQVDPSLLGTGSWSGNVSENGRIAHHGIGGPTDTTPAGKTGRNFATVPNDGIDHTVTPYRIPGTDLTLTGTAGQIVEPGITAPYALLCTECHQAYSTWTAKNAGDIGQTHMTPLPGFEDLVPVMDTNKFTTTKPATGQFSASFGCSVAGKTNYTDCTTAGGTVTYKPGGMSHGAVATILNSPHGKVTGYVDAKSPGTADSTLRINGGTLSSGIPVKGQFNTYFASEAGVAGACSGCHNVHGYLEGYVETNATNVKETLTACTECHASHGQSMAHPTGPGTPYADGNYGSQESCSTCHLSKVSGTTYHFLRINPDPNYSTFPSAQSYYTTPGSGKFGKLNTYNSGETYKDANGTTQPYPAVALDVDIACGQCHIGGNGDKNVNGGGNPYGLTPPAPVPGGMVPAAYSRAFLAEKAVNMHNTQAPVPTFSPVPGSFLSGSLPLSVTISDSGSVEGSPVAIFYTTDGSTPATDVSAGAYVPKVGTTTQQCANPCNVAVNGNETIYAIAAGPQSYGYSPGIAAGGAYTFQVLAKPTFYPSQGNYTTTSASVTVSGPYGATLYYTKDGTDPTTSSTQYTGPIVLNSYTILKAIAVASGYAPSAVATSGAYTFSLPTPTFSNASGAKYPGSYSLAANGGSVTVKLNDANASATICYTTNGTTPTATNGGCVNGTALAAGGTFTLATPGYTTVKAIAAAPTYNNSRVVSGTYSLY